MYYYALLCRIALRVEISYLSIIAQSCGKVKQKSKKKE